MALGRCRPLGVRGEVHRAPAARLLELALDRVLCVRNKSPAVRMPRNHAVNYQLHLSIVHKPTRNHLAASRAALVNVALLDLFRWGERRQSTSRKGCGL